MKKYQYIASWDDQTLTRVGEPVVVLGDANVSQVEVTMPSNFLLDPTEAVARMYFLLPGEKESDFETLETATQDENGDYHVTWTIKHAHTQKGGRLAFSLTLIGDDAQWDSRTAIIPVYESRYQPESEEAEEPYTGRLTALEGSMASIRGEFAEVQDDFEELKETVTLGTPVPKSLASEMVEGGVYLYTGTEPGYTAGHIYYYVNGTLTDGGVYGGTSVDPTLTVSGAAADAKVTGDKIAEIKEDLSATNQSMYEVSDYLSSVPSLAFSIGTINITTGGAKTASNRIYAQDFIKDTGIIYAKVRDGASISLRFYTEATVASYVGYELFYSGIVNISEFVRNHNAKYVRIVLKYNDDADITDINDLSAYLSLSGTAPYFRRKEDIVLELEQGNYNVSPPRYEESTTRCRHEYMIQVDNQVTIEADAGYYYSLREFDVDKNYVGSSNWITGKTTYNREMNPNVAYILISFKDSADSTMTPAKMLEIAEHVHITTVDYMDERKYRVSLSTPVMQQKITDNIVIAPTLCAVKFKYESGKQPVPIGWLFRDNQEPYNFYWSSDGLNKELLFTWDKSVTDTGSRTPYEYAFGITYEGDIICTYRSELAYAEGASDADLRKNPIVYKHGDYSHPVVVDFSNSVAPTSWLMNCGYYAENGVVYFCEYTRFHHDYAYVWKVTAPYYNKSNWEIIKSFQVSGNQQGFKHCHNIERDPYTGILWLSTGDVPPTDPQYIGTPGIYYSADNGTTWTTLVEDSEKYCRQLNFIWTEDFVYWGSDSSTYETHFFMRAKRDGNGVIDLNTVEDLFQFYTRSATYHLCYSSKPHGILCLERMDNPSLNPINFYFWDIDEEKMLFVDRCDAIGNGYTGFRVEAINHYPAPNQIGYLCGFSINQSNIDMPGNKYISDYYTSGYVKRDTDNVGCLNNILIKIEPR